MDLEPATQRLTRRFGPDVEARCTALAFASGLDVDRLRAWCRAVGPVETETARG